MSFACVCVQRCNIERQVGNYQENAFICENRTRWDTLTHFWITQKSTPSPSHIYILPYHMEIQAENKQENSLLCENRARVGTLTLLDDLEIHSIMQVQPYHIEIQAEDKPEDSLK